VPSPPHDNFGTIIKLINY